MANSEQIFTGGAHCHKKGHYTRQQNAAGDVIKNGCSNLDMYGRPFLAYMPQLQEAEAEESQKVF